MRLPPSLLPSPAVHQLTVNSSYRTPFSRYCNRSRSIPLRCLRSPTPSLNYYKRAISEFPQESRRAEIPSYGENWPYPKHLSNHSNRYIGLNRGYTDKLHSRTCRLINENEDYKEPSIPREDISTKYRANYKTVLEDTIKLQNMYRNINSTLPRNISDEYAHLRPGYKQKDTTTSHVFVPSYQTRFEFNENRRSANFNLQNNSTESSHRSRQMFENQMSAKFDRIYKDATQPSATAPTFSHQVRNPHRYLAATLSTGIYNKSRCTMNSPETKKKGFEVNYIRGIKQDNEWNQKPNNHIPREIRLAEKTFDFVRHTTLDKMRSRQAYGKPFFEIPLVVGI